MESIMSESNPSHQNAADITRVSLKQTLEKLFGDEQLQRTKHIQYVADLLISYPTDQCLEGLNLDLLDFDLETSSVVARPAALVSSRKHTVSATPVTWYVNSIAQLAESEENALIWNILVLKAAIYLIALPDIKPELFKEDHTEHFNTVKRLFQRFRTANRILSSEKEYQNTPEYRLLWEKYLKDPSLSLVEFIRYLNEVIDKEGKIQVTLGVIGKFLFSVSVSLYGGAAFIEYYELNQYSHMAQGFVMLIFAVFGLLTIGIVYQSIALMQGKSIAEVITEVKAAFVAIIGGGK
jgi:hypothetical protein